MWHQRHLRRGTCFSACLYHGKAHILGRRTRDGDHCHTDAQMARHQQRVCVNLGRSSSLGRGTFARRSSDAAGLLGSGVIGRSRGRGSGIGLCRGRARLSKLCLSICVIFEANCMNSMNLRFRRRAFLLRLRGSCCMFPEGDELDRPIWSRWWCCTNHPFPCCRMSLSDREE